jgi:hypothetical protein
MASDETTTTTRRFINMQSPIRALLYGIAIWFVWVSVIVFSAEILPTGITGSPLFVSMQAVALAALVLGSAILYLRKVGESSFKEGLLVGLGWVVVLIAIDLAHSVVMPEMVPTSAPTSSPSSRRTSSCRSSRPWRWASSNGGPSNQDPERRRLPLPLRSLKEVR